MKLDLIIGKNRILKRSCVRNRIYLALDNNGMHNLKKSRQLQYVPQQINLYYKEIKINTRAKDFSLKYGQIMIQLSIYMVMNMIMKR